MVKHAVDLIHAKRGGALTMEATAIHAAFHQEPLAASQWNAEAA